MTVSLSSFELLSQRSYYEHPEATIMGSVQIIVRTLRAWRGGFGGTIRISSTVVMIRFTFPRIDQTHRTYSLRD